MNGVHKNTSFLTKHGYLQPIGELYETYRGRYGSIWNGFKYVNATIQKNSLKTQLFLVTLTNGLWLKCSATHTWIIDINSKSHFITTKDLRIGDTLASYKYPILDEKEDKEDPYIYESGLNVFEKMPDVPVCSSIINKLQWIKGVHDAMIMKQKDGIIPNTHFANYILQLVLSTLGIRTSLMFVNEWKSKITLNTEDFNELKKHGYSIDGMVKVFDHWDSVTIKSIQPLEIFEETYFIQGLDKEKHVGVIYDGVLTT